MNAGGIVAENENLNIFGSPSVRSFLSSDTVRNSYVQMVNNSPIQGNLHFVCLGGKCCPRAFSSLKFVFLVLESSCTSSQENVKQLRRRVAAIFNSKYGISFEFFFFNFQVNQKKGKM